MLKLLSLTEIKIVWYWSKDGQMEQNSKSRNRTTYIQSPDVQESHILVNQCYFLIDGAVSTGHPNGEKEP